MKTRRPLAGERTLPILQFRTMEREGQATTAVGPAAARKRPKSSLKINRLEETGFRAHMSAATLKLCLVFHRKPLFVLRFRAHMSAATLKRRLRHLRVPVLARFRAHMSAATLKLTGYSH